jgi:hypothetical protein
MDQPRNPLTAEVTATTGRRVEKSIIICVGKSRGEVRAADYRGMAGAVNFIAMRNFLGMMKT